MLWHHQNGTDAIKVTKIIGRQFILTWSKYQNANNVTSSL